MTYVVTCAPPGLSNGTMFDKWCQGFAVTPPNKHIKAPYDASLKSTSILDGARALDATVRTLLNETAEDVIGFGQSQGMQVISEWLATYGRQDDRPDAKRLRFIGTGNPLRPGTGKLVGGWEVGPRRGKATPTDTEYLVTDVARQYDGWAIKGGVFSRNWWGMIFDHSSYWNVNLYKPDLVSEPVMLGNTTLLTVR